MHSLYLTTSVRYYPERNSVRVPPWKSLGLCLRVTNKGKSGFGKASDSANAKDLRPQGILGVNVVGSPRKGALSTEGLYRVPP